MIRFLAKPLLGTAGPSEPSAPRSSTCRLNGTVRRSRFGLALSLCVLSLGVGSLSVPGAEAFAGDWRIWRGPTRDNHVPAEDVATVPSTWSTKDNVLWKSPVPGKGHATPIVVGQTVYVLTHEAATQTISLLRYDLETGGDLGRTVVHQNVVPPRYLHKKNTCASCTPSSDGRGIFMVAQVNDQIVATGMTLDGRIVWQRPVAPYRGGGGWFGYGASPLLLDEQVVVAVDVDRPEGGLVSLDRRTGRPKWKTPRTDATSYSTPILADVAGRPSILISGLNRVAAYDPEDGRQQWSVPATSRTTCATMVWTDSMAFASGSYPEPGTFGIRVTADGAQVAWENRVKCYEQSMLVVDDHLYGIADNGIAYCWRCSDGEERWKARLAGPISASPLLVGNRILATNERGTTTVFAATPDRYQPIAENQWGDSAFASPIVADGKLILRHAVNEGNRRQEYLVAIGQP